MVSHFLKEFVKQPRNVESYDGRVIGAQAFVTPSEWKLPQNVAPPERYLKLIRDGCKDMGIDLAYQQWLQSISSNKGQRGPEYWDAPANFKKKARVDGSPRPGVQKSGLGPLKISALSEFAVGHEGLVDIGANLGKCAPQDLAAQLLRASAANVSHVILTGCRLKEPAREFHAIEGYVFQWGGNVNLTLMMSWGM